MDNLAGQLCPARCLVLVLFFVGDAQKCLQLQYKLSSEGEILLSPEGKIQLQAIGVFKYKILPRLLSVVLCESVVWISS